MTRAECFAEAQRLLAEHDEQRNQFSIQQSLRRARIYALLASVDADVERDAFG